MTIDEQVNSILAENERRKEWLRADYNPVTGEGLPNRARLEIPDFAIPVQYVPKRMMKNRFVKEVVKAKTIEAFLQKHPDDPKIRTHHDVEIMLRRIRHRYDFPFWAYFCFEIIAKEGGEIPFRLNRPQLEVDELVESLIEQRVPIDIIIVKARQWGGSTYSIARQTHIQLCLNKYHSFCVAAHVQGAAENILRMLKHALERYPAWDLGLPENETLNLLPVGKAGNAYAIKDSHGRRVVPGLIYIGSAQYPDTLRSPNVSGAHYSEVGVWPNTPERDPNSLVGSISGGILKRPLTMQVMESTAKTTDDYFHEVYVDAKSGSSNYHPIFIPWFHIPHDTIPIEDPATFVRWLLEHSKDEKPEGAWKDPGKHYWWLWTLGATLEGINWYRYKRGDFTRYCEMANEAPSTDVEAFQAAGQHVFDIYQIEALRPFCRKPVWYGRLVSEERRGKGVLKDIRFVEQKNGNLMIWEKPDDSPISYRYVVCVDIGGPNATSDYHSVRVLDRMMMMPEFNGRPGIVAEMHYHCKRDDLAWDAVRLAEYYNHALLVIESNTYEMTDKNRDVSGDGSQYILDLCAEVYTNLYARDSSPEEIQQGKPTKWGFRTDGKTKPEIIDHMQWAIEERAWDEPNAMCLDELSRYIEDKPSHFTAPPKKHDDILMSTAILLWIAYRKMPLPKWTDINRNQYNSVEPTIVSF